MTKKKKDKKKFKRKKIQISNFEINDVNDFSDRERAEEKRAEKKTMEKGDRSSKSNLNLVKGRVLEIKSNYRALVKLENKKVDCTLSGRLKQVNFETRNIIAVGDYVNVDIADEARIEEILPRRNTLSRFSEKDFQTEIILASNLNQIVITSSTKQPDLNLGLIDRFLCSAAIANIDPIICINKIDLENDLTSLSDSLEFYRENNYKVVITSAKTGEGINQLLTILKGKDTAFAGHSGTGKSSLLNKIQPGLKLQVAEVSESSQKGTHTTSSAKLIEWDFGGYLVDTPGIKTFGLQRVNSDVIPSIFPGIASLRKNCKFNDCSHTHEIKCAVKNAVENGHFPLERYESYLRIIESL